MSEAQLAEAEHQELLAREQLDRMRAAATEAAALTASARTPDGAATVKVGAGGAVLSIDVRAGTDSSALGPALVAAIRAATADVARQGAALLAERTGVDISARVLAAQVQAGDPVAVGLAEDAARRTGAAPGATEEAGDVDWLEDDPR